MAKKIKIRVFNTLESSNLMVSGWYSNKGNPNTRYGLFTGYSPELQMDWKMSNWCIVRNS